MFNKIVREDNYALFQKQTKKYYSSRHCNTNLDVIKSLYKNLQKEYRCEYIYKNNLVVKLIKKHSLSNTLILNELKIGSSKADLVMLNGVIQVFEIKTELDDFTKLSKQLKDYQKFADKVSVVTDEKNAEKLRFEYANTSIGIIILDSKNKLQTIKDSDLDTSFLDFETIFKILRKQEYLDLVSYYYGSIPDVPNTKIFKVCYHLLASIDIIEFQKQVLNKLKERKLKRPEYLKSSHTPKELKHICNSLDFNEKEYSKLYHFLISKSQCINHI